MTTLRKREAEACELLCRGLNNKEIANQMRISIRTVESYREVIYDKMGVRNAVELVRKVYRIDEPQLVPLAFEPMGEIDLSPGALNRVTR